MPSVVYEAGAAAVHFLAGHGSKVDQKAKLIVGVELLHVHVLWLVFFFHEKAAYLAPNVPTFDVVVVQHVGRPVYRDAYFLYVGEDLSPQQCTAPQKATAGLSLTVFGR